MIDERTWNKIDPKLMSEHELRLAEAYARQELARTVKVLNEIVAAKAKISSTGFYGSGSTWTAR